MVNSVAKGINRIALWAQTAALKFGVVAKRSNYNSRSDLRLQRFLEVNEIDTVLDVGANRGEYAADLLKGGFKGRIFSFEALPDMHERLLKRAAETSEAWIIAPRCAISDEEGTAQFHVTSAASSSSLLPPSNITDDMPDIFSVRKVIEVPTRLISDLCDELGVTSTRMFLKLDIQGGEERALNGAEAMLPRIAGMVVEMSLRELYEGQSSLRALDSWITERGFDLWDIEPAWRHRETGRLEQIDAIYFRRFD